MTPAPHRTTPAGIAYNDLRNLARREGRDPSEYFTLYALEGVLARLAASDHAADFVLKGGVLMAAFAQRRPTRDIDLAVLDLSSDVVEIQGRVRDVLLGTRDDGLEFDLDSLGFDAIREDSQASGVRVRVVARLATAQVPLHIDVNLGDPIWPAPTDTELPLLLGGTLTLQGYPDHMVLAEKIVTAVDRGEQNTRWRDFVDIVALSDARRVGHDDLLAAMEVVARHRQVRLEPLGPLVADMPRRAQPRWAVWRRKQRVEATTPESFADLLARCLRFADPVLAGEVSGCVWDTETRSWSRPSGT